jgi:formylglycine-generating enzyme required for sulfatase activity
VNFPGSFENEIPEHSVTIAPFRMDRYEVTNQRFSEFVAANQEWRPGGQTSGVANHQYLGHWTGGTFPAGMGQNPVAFITWHAAQSFCRWAGGRLPTEAEWEYAARGRGENEFPWGNDLPTPDKANYSASKIQGTTAVGSYPPNSLGLYDMAGNVWEWTLDEWRTSYSVDTRDDPAIDLATPKSELKVQGRRVIRGASFGGAIINLRTRWRDSHEVSNAVAFVGFRCVYP